MFKNNPQSAECSQLSLHQLREGSAEGSRLECVLGRCWHLAAHHPVDLCLRANGQPFDRRFQYRFPAMVNGFRSDSDVLCRKGNTEGLRWQGQDGCGCQGVALRDPVDPSVSRDLCLQDLLQQRQQRRA